MNSMPRLMLGAPASGSGKTMLTCALMALLRDRGLRVAPFKCGPDYVDPMLHSRILGTHSYSLDLFLSGEEVVRHQLCSHMTGRDIALIEGVMGYYDGLGGTTDRASSWHVAQATHTPVVLVVHAKGTSLTLAAQVQGLLAFRKPHQLAGFILNHCTPGLYALIAPMLTEKTWLRALGYLPSMPDCAIESRSLGLAPDAATDQKIAKLAAQAAETVDVDALLALAQSAPPLYDRLPSPKPVATDRPRIAIAQDEAFCFHYRANWELLQQLGAELLAFSPLRDAALPAGAQGLYLPGGYPELYARELSGNARMRSSIRAAIGAGMPAIAEGGGFLYLHSQLEGDDGQMYPMADVWPYRAYRTPRLVRFGYCHVRARADAAFCKVGERYPVHAFHRWDSENAGDAFTAEKPLTGRTWPCIAVRDRLLAGFPQWYFPGAVGMAKAFVKSAEAIGRNV